MPDQDDTMVDKHDTDTELVSRPGATKLGQLFQKDGGFSKTAAILVMAWALGLLMWTVQSLTAGFLVLGFPVPAFDSGAALAMLGAASSLYFATHNIKANVGQS